MRKSYPKQNCLTHRLSFECFHFSLKELVLYFHLKSGWDLSFFIYSLGYRGSLYNFLLLLIASGVVQQSVCPNVSQYRDVVSVKYLYLLHHSTYHCFIAIL